MNPNRNSVLALMADFADDVEQNGNLRRSLGDRGRPRKARLGVGRAFRQCERHFSASKRWREPPCVLLGPMWDAPLALSYTGANSFGAYDI